MQVHGGPSYDARRNAEIVHDRFFHPGKERLKHLDNTGIKLDPKAVDELQCPCQGQSSKRPHPPTHHTVHGHLQRIHTDQMGPMPCDAFEGERLATIITDEKSMYRHITGAICALFQELCL